MTIKDIAKSLNLSPSTVSRVLNGNSKAASPETKDLIWSKVHETGFKINANAKELRQNSSSSQKPKRVCCLFARTVDSYIDPFFTELLQSVEKETFDLGYSIRTILSTNELLDNSIFDDPDLCGAIVLGRMDQKTYKILSTRFSYIAYAGLNTMTFDVDQILSSGYKAAKSAVDYYVSNGHQKIVYLGETVDEQRYSGYFDAMVSYNLTPQYVLSPLTSSDSYRIFKEQIERGLNYSSVFCANDDTAIGVLRALNESHMKAGRDIDVLGLGNIRLSRYMSPMLSTINIPIEEMGRQVSRCLIDRIETRRKFPITIELPNELILRETTKINR